MANGEKYEKLSVLIANDIIKYCLYQLCQLFIEANGNKAYRKAESEKKSMKSAAKAF